MVYIKLAFEKNNVTWDRLMSKDTDIFIHFS